MIGISHWNWRDRYDCNLKKIIKNGIVLVGRGHFRACPWYFIISDQVFIWSQLLFDDVIHGVYGENGDDERSGSY